MYKATTAKSPGLQRTGAQFPESTKWLQAPVAPFPRDLTSADAKHACMWYVDIGKTPST